MPRHSRFDLDFRPAAYWPEESPADRGSVEIARIKLNRGPTRLVRLIARPVADGVGYQIGKDLGRPYDAIPTSTMHPLTFVQLVDMIEDTVAPKSIRPFHRLGKIARELGRLVEA